MRAQLADLLTYRESKEPVSSLQEKIVPHVGIQEMPDREVTLFFDGSYRRVSKEGRIGFVIYDAEGKEVCAEHFEDGRIHRNNEA